MGRRQAWPGQVLGKSAIELSKKKIIVKEFYFGEQPKQKLSQIMVTVQKEGGGDVGSAPKLKLSTFQM